VKKKNAEDAKSLISLHSQNASKPTERGTKMLVASLTKYVAVTLERLSQLSLSPILVSSHGKA